MTKGSSTTLPAERTLTTTRVFDAPRELVYRAWTDVKQFARWFPPDGFSADCELDVRPGGVIRVDMKGEDPALGPDFAGKVFPGKGVYKEVVPNERLALTFDAPGPDGPMTLLMTVLFEAEGRKTKLTIHQTADTVGAYNDLVKIGAAEGLRQSLDKLTLLLAGRSPETATEVKGRTLTLTRVFDAPRDLVWTAYTDPAHIVKWMFAKDWETPFAEADVRAGGAVRIGMRPADHSEEGFVFEGTYREIVKPERIVLDISDGRVMTTTFQPAGEKTKLTLSVEMAESEENERTGYSQILENFARHIATLKKA